MPSSAWRKNVCSRSEEHTSELQSLTKLVCRLLLGKKQSIQRAHPYGTFRLASSSRPLGETSEILHFVFFFNDTATTEIYTLSLHDALPISEKLERSQTLLLENLRFHPEEEAN